MNADDLRERTLEFGLRIVHLFRYLQQRTVAEVLGRQLLRCGTSVGADYRAASLAKSPADFVSKVKISRRTVQRLKKQLISKGVLLDSMKKEWIFLFNPEISAERVREKE